MKKIGIWFACTLAILVISSCSSSESESVTAPSIAAVNPAMTVDSEGGSYMAAITVSNPTDDGSTSASASVSWISVTLCSESAVSFNTEDNTTSDLRTGTVTASYYYEAAGKRNFVSCDITVTQAYGEDPIISLQSAEISTEIEGGTYSFSYSVLNSKDEGKLLVSCDAEWISGISIGASEITFTSDANHERRPRTADIELSYVCNTSTTAETVAVTQDYKPPIDLTGTYTCSGHHFYYGRTEWTLRIFEYDGDPDSFDYDSKYEYFIDGFFPPYVGYYEYYGDHRYSAAAYVDFDDVLHVPSQIKNTIVQATNGIEYVDYWYMGYTPCTSPSAMQYNLSFPDLSFTYDPEGDKWVGDYGLFMALWFIDVSTPEIGFLGVCSESYSPPSLLMNFDGSNFLDCVYSGDFTIKKTSDEIEPMPPATMPTGTASVPETHIGMTAE